MTATRTKSITAQRRADLAELLAHLPADAPDVAYVTATLHADVAHISMSPELDVLTRVMGLYELAGAVETASGVNLPFAVEVRDGVNWRTYGADFRSLAVRLECPVTVDEQAWLEALGRRVDEPA